jgi:prolyl-tRNA synthetase
MQQFNSNLLSADLIDLNSTVSGAFTWLPNGVLMRNLFLDEAKRILGEYDFLEYSFPDFASKDEVDIMTSKIKDFSNNIYFPDNDRALSPSGESIIYPYFRSKIKTQKDLPLKLFQIGRSFRKGTTRSVFRLNENRPFIEIHTAHATRQEAEHQIVEDIKCFREIMSFVGLPSVFSSRPLWGNNPVAEEIFAFDTLLPNGETIHLNSVYSQMQTFSKPFDIQFSDNEGRKDFTYQTEFGFGCRMIFSALFLSMKENTFIIPPQLAPIQVIIIPIICKDGQKEIVEFSIRIADELNSSNIRVKIDDNFHKSVGKRRSKYDNMGIPLRLEIGQNEFSGDYVTLVAREMNEIIQVSSCFVVHKVQNALEETRKVMNARIGKTHDDNIIEADSFNSILKAIESGKIVSTPLCNSIECSKKLERTSKGEVLGYQKEVVIEKCVICGNNTQSVVFFARHV